MAEQQSQQTPDSLTINGRFLQHYLRTMERMQETFDKEGDEGLPAFNKYVYYLRSIINDPIRVRKIDRAMVSERDWVSSPEFKKMYGEISDEQKEFMIGFRVINGCMKYLANTLNIHKVQGKDMSDINGLMLEHFLRTQERMQGAFTKADREGLGTFNKFVFYLRAIITDDKKVDAIDQKMLEQQTSLEGNDNQKQWIIGFTVVSGCMAYVDHTMKINKRHVKVPAAQMDPRMPSPREHQEDDEEDIPDDNDTPRIFTGE